MIKKTFVIILQKLDILSSISMRLVQITGKHPDRVHPKHLINQKIWYSKYLKKNQNVFDLGCGSAQSTLKIAKKVKSIVASDIDVKSIEIGEKDKEKSKIKNVRFLILDANKKLPFNDNSFDIVICSDVLEHLNKRNFALNEIRRILKKNGLLFLVTDNPSNSWKKLQKAQGLFFYADVDHKYEYPKEEILKILKDKKFQLINVATATYDTPLKGLIDLTGGISMSLYKNLRLWKDNMVKKYPEETTGYRIVARKI